MNRVHGFYAKGSSIRASTNSKALLDVAVSLFPGKRRGSAPDHDSLA
jgi:hypothetical protein